MANNFGNFVRRITNLFIRMNDTTDGKFVGTTDRFHGVTVNTDDSEPEYNDEKKVEKRLLDSLECWIQDGVRGVWFRVNLIHSHWIPVLAKHGFVFHHAKPRYVMMVRWLPQDEKSAIPTFPHNFVGVGALVYSDKQVLVVKERFYKKPQWKFPGGYVELGEDIGAAATREVLEETGIEAEFVSLIAFRHVHKVQFGCSDLFFVCHLIPKTKELKMCKRELVDCMWTDLDKFATDPEVTEFNRLMAQTFIDSIDTNNLIKTEKMTHVLTNTQMLVYKTK